MGQALVFAIEFWPLVCLRRELVDFGYLPLQALAFLLALLLALRGLFQLLTSGLPLLPQRADGSGVDAAIAVEQGARAGGLHQALPGMLAVDVHQQAAECAQLGGRGRCAIDPAAALALAVDQAAQQQAFFGVCFDAIFIQQRCQRRGDVEVGGDVCAAATLAHKAGIGACAHYQLQRIHQNGFACACLAGEHREAVVNIQIQRLHDHEILQGDTP